MKAEYATIMRGRRKACRAAWLLAGVLAVMLLPWPAKAVKQTPPLTMSAAFANPKPELGRNETLRITLTTTRAYSNLTVVVTLPAEIALISGSSVWQGALQPGAPQELVLTVMLNTAGRYAIYVDAAFDPAESEFSGSRISLNVIAEAGGVAASLEPFSLMDLKRAKTADDKKRLLSAPGVSAPTPSAPRPPAVLPPLLKPGKEQEQPGKPPKPQSLSRDTISVTVSGTITYQDAAGVAHPIRFAKVKVIDVDVAFDDVIGEGYTAADGTYSIAASGGDVGSGPDIQVRVYCAINNDVVASVGPDASSTYDMYSAEYTDHTSSTLEVSLTTGAPVRGSATDDENARRFSVLDAMLQAAAEAYALHGYSSVLPKIPVIFPVGGDASYYSSSDMTINILRADALDWDVLFHEFGHFLSDKGASSRFDRSPGGKHSGGSTIPLHGKQKGIRLAWSEGWATFFGIELQVEPTQNLLALPAIPNAGDRTYHDTEDQVLTADLETIGNGALGGSGQGYASEYSVMAVLYDLCDAAVDASSDGLSQDYTDVTPQQIWNAVNTGDWDDIGKFYNFLCALASYDISTVLLFSQVFAMNNVGPELLTPSEGQIVSSVISTQFTWQANGDPTAGYAHNRFTLVVGKNNLTTILGTKDDIQDTKYTFSDGEWQAITAQSDESGILQWAVAGYNSLDPRMPSAAGVGKFVSNKQNIKLRAYHIRLTWDNLGADVDLHLSPPSGEDCYYSNRNPDWGVPGDSSDDPSLDRDCIDSCTEENLTLEKVTTPGTYKVWVHYYSDHSQGPSLAFIEVFKNGRSLGYTSRLLNETGDSWDVFSFSISSLGLEEGIVETPDEVTPGVLDLPPKTQEE